jgi:hypothetical protein
MIMGMVMRVTMIVIVLTIGTAFGLEGRGNELDAGA